MVSDEGAPGEDLSAGQREALHELELGIEWLQRAHGALVEFHHNTGHAMDHLETAEDALRESGHEEFADAIQNRYLPRGVIDDDRWSYDVLETFETDFLSEVTDFEEHVRRDIADDRRHVTERRQEREWKHRSTEK